MGKQAHSRLSPVAPAPLFQLLLQISISFTKDLTRKQLKKLRNKVNNAIENGSFTNKLGLLGKTDFIPTHA